MSGVGHVDNARNLSYRSLGSQALLHLLGELEDYADGARVATDIEDVHKARVTSRRLRAAMLLFEECFSRPRVKRWRSVTKGVTQSLGMARDADVQIEFLRDYLSAAKDPELKRSIRLLLDEFLRKRAGMQEAVMESLDMFRDSGVPEEIRDVCGKFDSSVTGRRTYKPSSGVLLGANVHVIERIDDLLALQECVDDEKDVTGHHEMRIAAKHLRYTMEIFAPVFKGGLAAEIRAMTKLQDILGEVHDSDVWSEYLRRYIKNLKTEQLVSRRNIEEIARLERGLAHFLRDMRQRRLRAYSEFVTYWYALRKNRMLEKLEEKLSATLAQAADEWLSKISQKRSARIALISDVHGNLQALEAVMTSAASQGANMFLNAGDLIGYGPQPNEVVEMLRSPNVLSVVGNFDLELLHWNRSRKPKDEMEKAEWIIVKELKESNARYLRLLPRAHRLKIGGRRVLLTHGSPDSIEEYIDSGTGRKRLKKLAKMARADIVVSGHSHSQFSGTARDVAFVNPGSVGRPDDGDSRAAYSILSLDPFRVEMHRVHYDLDAATRAMRRARFPECFSQMLFRGVSPKAVLKADKKLAQEERWRSKETLDAVRKIARGYGHLDMHSEHVALLALKLFDQLDGEHGMGAQERYWLDCAAALHDIGWSEGRKGHHKTSMRLILNDQELPFTTRERLIVSSIARYHRKALPSKAHYCLEQLGAADRERVLKLSALLRLADGLDSSHLSLVHGLSVRIGTGTVSMTVLAGPGADAELRVTLEKKDLFEKVFGRQMRISWRTERSVRGNHDSLAEAP